MNQDEYLRLANISTFCDWLSKNLESTDLAATYEDRRSRKLVQFRHIYDAYSQYAWPFNLRLPDKPSCYGLSFEENHKALVTLQTGLRNAVAQKNDTETLRWTHSVLRWGGVFAKNGVWLTEHKAGLAEYFADRSDCLHGQADDNALTEIGRFNSGMSKIYSLLVDDFIIYDSRVAAALGWIVVKYCQQQGLHEVPKGLRFPWAPAKEAPNIQRPKLRNPSKDKFLFPRLQPGVEYARWNLRASWLLSEVVLKTQSAFAGLDNPLRALEAALFMIGYDLGHSNSGTTSEPQPNLESSEAQQDDLPFRLQTRGGRAIKFNYDYTNSSISITNENGRVDHFEKNKTEGILTSLHHQFGNHWFSLANNVEKLGNGTEIPGLGRTILDAYPGNIEQAQAASYFGPIMEDMGLFEWNGKSKGIAWRLTCEPSIQLPELDD